MVYGSYAGPGAFQAGEMSVRRLVAECTRTHQPAPSQGATTDIRVTRKWRATSRSLILASIKSSAAGVPAHAGPAPVRSAHHRPVTSYLRPSGTTISRHQAKNPRH